MNGSIKSCTDPNSIIVVTSFYAAKRMPSAHLLSVSSDFMTNRFLQPIVELPLP